MPDLSARPLSAQGAVGSARPQTASVAAPRRAAVSRMVPPVDAVAVDGRDDAEIAVFALHTSRQWVGLSVPGWLAAGSADVTTYRREFAVYLL